MKHLLHSLLGIIHKHGFLTFILLALLATAFDTYGFIQDAQMFKPIMIAKAVVQSFADLPTDENFYLVFGKLLWMLAFMSATVSLFLKEWSYKQLIASIKEHKHTAIIGVDSLDSNYIPSLDTKNTLIYTLDEDSLSKDLKEKNFAIKKITTSTILENLTVGNMQSAVINLGKDRDNINTAFEIISSYLETKCTNNLRLIVRIESKELTSLFRSNAVFQLKAYKDSTIEIKTYSFFEECASTVFRDNDIDGEDDTIITSDEEYSIIIAGDGELAKKIIYEAAKIAHLPNENILNIYLLSSQPERFKEALITEYPGIQSSTLKLHTKELDYTNRTFFNDEIWKTKNLTNAIIAYDDEDTNLLITAALQSKTFLREKAYKTKILFGVFNQGSIAKTIDEDQLGYKNFIPFGDAKVVLTKENIFDDRDNQIAKFINYTYYGLTDNGSYNPNKSLGLKKEDIDKKWFSAPHNDQLSSLAQAKHIKMKLKALGLSALKSDAPKEKLIQENRKILESKFSTKYEGNYSFPDNFNDTLFDKMTRMEHNRWNTYHFLNGWEYKHYLNEQPLKNQMKEIKLHNCLLPIEEFRITQFVKDDSQKLSELVKLIEWDIYSFMYIPNYLGEAGYMLKEATYE